MGSLMFNPQYQQKITIIIMSDLWYIYMQSFQSGGFLSDKQVKFFKRLRAYIISLSHLQYHFLLNREEILGLMNLFISLWCSCSQCWQFVSIFLWWTAQILPIKLPLIVLFLNCNPPHPILLHRTCHHLAF